MWANWGWGRGRGERGCTGTSKQIKQGLKNLYTNDHAGKKYPGAPEKQNLDVTTIKSAHDKKLDKYYGTIDDTLWK